MIATMTAAAGGSGDSRGRRAGRSSSNNSRSEVSEEFQGAMGAETVRSGMAKTMEARRSP